MRTLKKRIGIIGGGITGLAAACHLEQAIASGANIDYDLFEASNRLGGKIRTEYRNGFIIERGPDSFLARKQSMARLAKEIGMENELLANDTGQAFILKGETLHPMPEGAVMGIPTQLKPFLKTGLLSPIGKIVALKDLVLPSVTESDEDISLGHFFRRRLGDEVVDYLIEPLLSGIYAGDLDRLSLRSTFPQFQKMVEEHGSLIKGISKQRTKNQRSTKSIEKKQGMFLSFKRGLESFVDGIEAYLQNGTIYKNACINEIVKNENRYDVQFMNDSRRYDSVIVTTPAPVVGQMFNDDQHFSYLNEMKATSVATVAMAFKEEQVPLPYDGTGFVVSKKGDHIITACTWTHKKWKHTAPEGYALLRAYVGRTNDSEIVDQSDEQIVKAALDDLKTITHIEGQPEFFYVTRWKEAMPQYEVGHSFKVEKLTEDIEKTYPGVYLAGGAYKGIGLPDCIDQGEAAAKDALMFVKGSL
ncbi:protoporphyrinogen oxidase [Halalkalibacter hemicellulosilyticus]|uniref:Coproporphyrinogen III oxidase n=1 Tax=Halalkalibacter hemicellulosilyticusJCM 9152 TaxID=1236971 RepID=W4QEA1_9BACI|nr:protoporphyrinogen oxidase [Halalkalibacter hemicellulosilyticus]GAE30390.1 protoporphyrinogen IX oxidase [Halalkalibacter hemicellulosilyticusJCM 9152]